MQITLHLAMHWRVAVAVALHHHSLERQRYLIEGSSGESYRIGDLPINSPAWSHLVSSTATQAFSSYLQCALYHPSSTHSSRCTITRNETALRSSFCMQRNYSIVDTIFMRRPCFSQGTRQFDLRLSFSHTWRRPAHMFRWRRLARVGTLSL